MLLKTCMEPHKQCYASISVQSSGDCQDVNTRRRYNKVPEPPRYDNTRRRYNKVPEPPIPHYEAEIQQSTGAANTTLRGGDTTKYRSRQYNIRGGDTTKYRSRQYNIRGGDTTKYRSRQYPIRDGDTITQYCYSALLQYTEAEIHQEYQQPTQLQLLCTVTIIPRPRYTKSTNSRHSYNYSVLLQ